MGKEGEVAEITRAGIDGRIDWEQGFRLRAKILQGLPQAQILRAARRLRPVPGAQEFVHWLRTQGNKTVTVTGGPREVAESALAHFDLDAAFSNEFIYDHGVFTGDVVIHVSPRSKGEIVRHLARRYDVPKENILAFGDGLMDVPLLSEAGVAVGIHSNGKLKDHVDFETSDFGEAHRWLIERDSLKSSKRTDDR